MASTIRLKMMVFLLILAGIGLGYLAFFPPHISQQDITVAVKPMGLIKG